MKARWLGLVMLLALLVSLFPAGAAFAGNDGSYKFSGTVESLPATGLVGDWVVSGRTVHVTAATRIEQEHGQVAVGAYVEVQGAQQADNSVNATKIEVKQGSGSGSSTKFSGTIQSLPASGLIGDWVVSGRTVHVTAATRIEQRRAPVRVGAYVEVKGTQQADGSVTATKIEVKR
jgi:ABC-type xylose transport system substrate-binding protein